MTKKEGVAGASPSLEYSVNISEFESPKEPHAHNVTSERSHRDVKEIPKKRL